MPLIIVCRTEINGNSANHEKFEVSLSSRRLHRVKNSLVIVAGRRSRSGKQPFVYPRSLSNSLRNISVFKSSTSLCRAEVVMVEH